MSNTDDIEKAAQKLATLVAKRKAILRRIREVGERLAELTEKKKRK